VCIVCGNVLWSSGLGVHCVWECVVEQWLGVHCVWECVVEQWLGVRRMLESSAEPLLEPQISQIHLVTFEVSEAVLLKLCSSGTWININTS